MTAEAACLDPNITVIRDALTHRDSALMDPPPLAVVRGNVEPKGMVAYRAGELGRGRIEDCIVQVNVQSWIVVSIIGISFPITRQAEDIGCFVETAVAKQLSIEAAFHALEHEFIELAVEHWADASLDPLHIYDHGGSGRARLGLIKMRGRNEETPAQQ